MSNPINRFPRFLLPFLVLALVTIPINGGAIAKTPSIPASRLYASEPHKMGMDDQETHTHQMLEIPASQPVPTVKLIAHPDAMKGWNLEVQVTNFRFAPEQVNTKSNTTEGHAHLYIDGQKITRLYGSWYYLASLTPGRHEIKVTLNTNGHETLAYQGQPIQGTVILQVPVPHP